MREGVPSTDQEGDRLHAWSRRAEGLIFSWHSDDPDHITISENVGQAGSMVSGGAVFRIPAELVKPD